MSKTANVDEKTLALIKATKEQRDEIAQAEKPKWVTNRCFRYHTHTSAESINLAVENDVTALVKIAAFLKLQENSYKDVVEEFDIDVPEFQWLGFNIKDWLQDIKTRINQVQIVNKKKRLGVLELRLNSIISPDLRRTLELEDIEKELLK